MNKIKNIIKLIKKYLLDAMIIIGIYIFSISTFTETKGGRFIIETITDWEKVYGVMLFSIGAHIIIRRYLNGKKYA